MAAARGRQPPEQGRVMPDMSAFVTLAGVYNMPAGADDAVNVSESTRNAQAQALNRFLAVVELKGFQIARSALRTEDVALAGVQDAMLQLARAYRGRPEQEWRPLFYRILSNRIRDLQRRRSVRSRVFGWLADPLEQVSSNAPSPLEQLELGDAIRALDSAVEALPFRQQQAFLLRNLEGLDVLQTAKAMGCSEGSVKTHYFRALRALRAGLRDHPS